MRKPTTGLAFLVVALLVASDLPAITGSGSAKLRVELDQKDEVVSLVLGPIDLPPNTHHGGIEHPPPLTTTVPIDGYLHGFTTKLVDADGNPVARSVLHHVNVIDPNHRELFTPIMRRLMAAGQETRDQSMPKLLGVPVHAGDTLVVRAMYHNPTPNDYKGVDLYINLSYSPKDQFLKPFEVYPFYIDVMPPDGPKAYDLPPGHSTKSWEGTPAVSGRILGIGGHLHDYSVSLRLENAETNEVLWEGKPELDENGRILGVPTGHLWMKGGVRLEKGVRYRVVAEYNNPTGKTILDGAMGAIGGIFMPDEGEVWPRVDKNDPIYQWDVEHTLKLPVGYGYKSGHQHH